jgi:hypothetical protein
LASALDGLCDLQGGLGRREVRGVDDLGLAGVQMMLREIGSGRRPATAGAAFTRWSVRKLAAFLAGPLAVQGGRTPPDP